MNTGRAPRSTCQVHPNGHLARVPRDAMRAADADRERVRTWLAVSLVNVAIWAIVCLGTMSWIYPWWVWVAGPWGGMLLAGAIAGHRRTPRAI
jgi:fatty acid desaturase